MIRKGTSKYWAAKIFRILAAVFMIGVLAAVFGGLTFALCEETGTLWPIPAVVGVITLVVGSIWAAGEDLEGDR